MPRRGPTPQAVASTKRASAAAEAQSLLKTCYPYYTPVRCVARTILDEVLGVRPDFIEHQLAHAVRDPNGRAYNRTAHLPERRKMMQLWADYLDGLKAGSPQ